MDLAQKTAEDAVALFKKGYACSEACLMAFEANTEIKFSEDTKRGMSAFVEGIAGAGCICGALTGSVFILSALGGRVTLDEPIDKLKKAARQLHDDFRAEFKCACCRVIKKNSSVIFGLGQYKSCHKTVAFCASRCVELAVENGWIKG